MARNQTHLSKEINLGQLGHGVLSYLMMPPLFSPSPLKLYPNWHKLTISKTTDKIHNVNTDGCCR